MAADFFWDTSGFFALLNTEDPAHARAREFLHRMQSQRLRGVTTSWVVGETCTLLIARRRPHLVPAFLGHVQSSQALRCLHPDEAHFTRAAGFLRKHLDQGYSFVDCSSMVLMREMGLRMAITTDHHFASAGFAAGLVAG